MDYFIVVNRVFDSLVAAQKFCAECDLDFDCIVEAEAKQSRLGLQSFWTLEGNSRKRIPQT